MQAVLERAAVVCDMHPGLMKHKVGDVVTVHVDNGYSYQVEIRQIIKENDESGDRIRSF